MSPARSGKALLSRRRASKAERKRERSLDECPLGMLVARQQRMTLEDIFCRWSDAVWKWTRTQYALSLQLYSNKL
ncbi:hypothetical protein BCON_0253g00070 [Botryotinia convoluta]|uniref:Uncharacterized protein n=1 Tax=Botryotinia convoluta TaxID=54673 RepID=A0A4Z1HG42_9HELO|nr:hypothetical protein BCON_0253g00070 [Botryotinia convoluta]